MLKKPNYDNKLISIPGSSGRKQNENFLSFLMSKGALCSRKKILCCLTKAWKKTSYVFL